MRTIASAGAVAAAAAASVLFAAAPAPAANGDNGTVKIHDAATGEELRKNEPKVCEFYLDAFGFDAAQQVTWKIVAWKPTGDNKTVADEGAIVLDGEGDGRTEDMTLPDGHYKLFWNWKGENGAAKHKVFWTECEDSSESPDPSDTPSGTPSDDSSEQAEQPGRPGKPGEDGGPGEDATPTASHAPGAQGGGDDESGGLAATGASVTGISIASAILLGAGGYLVLRRRGVGRQH
ncbi:hypothetical protein [Streptomyces sp. B5E4]|uniref:hypothetical protein n=1 Tax=Streptomyces sp. B5E4 TaxID=3153568 RepID=UPI00325CD6E6